MNVLILQECMFKILSGMMNILILQRCVFFYFIFLCVCSLLPSFAGAVRLLRLSSIVSSSMGK